MAAFLKSTFMHISRACHRVKLLRDNNTCFKCSSIRLKYTNSEYNDLFLEDKYEEELNRQSKKPLTKREQKEKQRRYHKHKVIAKKVWSLYREKEPNLLTWAARSQIQYLNKKDPIYWTPEMLSQSFPVSTSVIKAILRYDFLPPNEEFVQDYDQEVTTNWFQLAKAKDNLIERRPVDPKFRPLLESEKMSYIMNAAGSKSFPIPDVGSLQITQKDLAEKRRPQTKGEFTAILNDYEIGKAGLKEKEELKYIEFEDPNYMDLLTDLSKIASEEFQMLLKEKNNEELSGHDCYPDTGSLIEYQEDSDLENRYQKFTYDLKNFSNNKKKFEYVSSAKDSDYRQYGYKEGYKKFTQDSKDFSNERRKFKHSAEDSLQGKHDCKKYVRK